MPKDYKKRTTRKTKKTQQKSPWAWLLTGLCLGLISASAAYFILNKSVHDDPVRAIKPVPRQADKTADREAAEKQSSGANSKPRFDFYDMLPKFELILPETEEQVADRSSLDDNALNEVHILQTGSFPDFTDADKMKANLALLGLTSEIQKVEIDGQRTWHRVRIGPIKDRETLTQTLELLKENGIEPLLIKSRENP